MKALLSLAFQHKRHFPLIVFAVVSMLLATAASQMEIFTLGVITQTTPKISSESTKGFFPSLSGWIDAHLNVHQNITHLIFLILLVAAFKAITLFSSRFSIRLLSIRFSQDLRQKYFEHIQTLPMSFYQQHDSGSLSSRVVTDASSIAEAINAILVNCLQTPFTLGTTLLLCFFSSWKLSLLIFFGLPLIAFPIIFLAKRMHKISRQLQKNQEHFASILLDFLSGIQTVKMFAMESFSLKKYEEQNERMALLETKSARYDLSSRPIVHMIGMLCLTTALVYGLYILHMDVSEVLFYCGLLYLFYEPIKKFAEENGRIQKGIAAADRMFEVFSISPQQNTKENTEEIFQLQNEIEFRNVSFRYPSTDRWILKNISFKVKQGESVAIVGPTGSGKSTIVQLLPRLYDLQKGHGEILMDGHPITTYSSKSLREAIAFVPQKPFLFLDTIQANITFGRNFSQEKIIEASQQADIHTFIHQLPEGYHFQIAEGGKNLSGGQQQRVTIARALIKNASILIMDEGTSTLDTVSEQMIKRVMEELKGKVTQLIIAHRLSTIEHVDRILYLENGSKVDEGTKEELLARCEGFRKIWHAGQIN